MSIQIQEVEEVSLDLEERINVAKNASEWKGAGEEAGLDIFRIEKLNVKRIPKDLYGKFYDGDAYIVLHTTKNAKNECSYDIHYWLGNECSIDERGVCAYKVIELDEFFNTKASQYRETQGNESDKFLSYFPKGVKVLHGGVASGFKEAKPSEKAPRLIQFKGRVVIQSLEVPAKASSLNHGDAFLLETGKHIFIWKGKESRNTERFAAAQYADQLKDAAGEEVVHLDDNGSDEFWQILGGSAKDVRSASEGGDDAKGIKKPLKLFKISDSASKQPKFDLIAEGKDVNMSKFQTNDVFLLDAGHAIYVWVGVGSSMAERRVAMNTAIKYMKEHNLKNSTPVERVFEGSESNAFKNALKY